MNPGERIILERAYGALLAVLASGAVHTPEYDNLRRQVMEAAELFRLWLEAANG